MTKKIIWAVLLPMSLLLASCDPVENDPEQKKEEQKQDTTPVVENFLSLADVTQYLPYKQNQSLVYLYTNSSEMEFVNNWDIDSVSTVDTKKEKTVALYVSVRSRDFNSKMRIALSCINDTTLTVDYLFYPSVASRIACDTTYVVKKKSDAPKDIKLYDKGVEVLHLQSGEGVVQYLGNFNGLYTKVNEQ